MNFTNIFYVVFLTALLPACRQSHPKATSGDLNKTSVTINGKKDSVLNNTEKNYTSEATLSEPCVKCLITAVQNAESYKKLISGVPLNTVVYNINWITSKTPAKLSSDSSIINGVRIDLIKKSANKSADTLTTYLYDNKTSKFYIKNAQGGAKPNAEINAVDLKKIRNSCFWGVASNK